MIDVMADSLGIFVGSAFVIWQHIGMPSSTLSSAWKRRGMEHFGSLPGTPKASQYYQAH